MPMTMNDTRHIQLNYDPESGVWWAESLDLPGLVTEAPSLDLVIERVLAVAPDLLAANGGQSGDRVALEFQTVRQVQMA